MKAKTNLIALLTFALAPFPIWIHFCYYVGHSSQYKESVGLYFFLGWILPLFLSALGIKFALRLPKKWSSKLWLIPCTANCVFSLLWMVLSISSLFKSCTFYW